MSSAERGPQAAPRRVVYLVGPARSGASVVASALRALGTGVPQPTVSTDETDPASTQPTWVCELHDELVERCNLQASDARPRAWFRAGKTNTNEELRADVQAWLEAQLATAGPELVVHEPRLSWFTGLWRSAALRCDATPSYVSVLRSAPEVVVSQHRHHPHDPQSDVTRTAAWISTALHTERATRGSARALVRFDDLLADWTVPVSAIGAELGLDAVRRAHTNDLRRVHQLVDPARRHVQATWADLDVPAPLRELAEETEVTLARLALTATYLGRDDADRTPDRATDRTTEPEDVLAVQARLDELRAAYTAMYADAEALADSTAAAARREGLLEGSLEAGAVPDPGRAVPERLRALVPPSARRGIRKALRASGGAPGSER